VKTNIVRKEQDRVFKKSTLKWGSVKGSPLKDFPEKGVDRQIEQTAT